MAHTNSLAGNVATLNANSIVRYLNHRFLKLEIQILEFFK